MTAPATRPGKHGSPETDWESLWSGLGLSASILAAIAVGIGGVMLTLEIVLGGAPTRATTAVATLAVVLLISYPAGRLSARMQWVLPPIVAAPQLTLGLAMSGAGVSAGGDLVALALGAGSAAWLGAFVGGLRAHRRRRPAFICSGCGYNLVGLRKRNPCPECGEIPRLK